MEEEHHRARREELGELALLAWSSSRAKSGARPPLFMQLLSAFVTGGLLGVPFDELVDFFSGGGIRHERTARRGHAELA
jgi:hypothetical protein